MKYENKERDRVKYLNGLFDGIRKRSDFMRSFIFYIFFFFIHFPGRTAPSPFINIQLYAVSRFVHANIVRKIEKHIPRRILIRTLVDSLLSVLTAGLGPVRLQ